MWVEKRCPMKAALSLLLTLLLNTPALAIWTENDQRTYLLAKAHEYKYCHSAHKNQKICHYCEVAVDYYEQYTRANNRTIDIDFIAYGPFGACLNEQEFLSPRPDPIIQQPVFFPIQQPLFSPVLLLPIH